MSFAFVFVLSSSKILLIRLSIPTSVSNSSHHSTLFLVRVANIKFRQRKETSLLLTLISSMFWHLTVTYVAFESCLLPPRFLQNSLMIISKSFWISAAVVKQVFRLLHPSLLST